MAVETQPQSARAVELTRLFIEALNARDLNGLAELAADEIELRNPAGGKSLRGREGLERLVEAARDADVLVARVGEPEVSSADGVTRVEQWVREIAGTARFRGVAIFEVRDGQVTAFEIDSELLQR
jgi:ketosteroid isomerase-like protein